MILEDRLKRENSEWEAGQSKNITFIVTEDCQLRCKYCYITGKNSFNKMSFSVAKKAIDYILNNRVLFNEDSVIWDFIGGEPLLEIKLINDICNYIKIKAYELNHPWWEKYRFNISTNGLMYDNKSVQKFIKNNYLHLNIGISLDGNKTKHDLQRVFPNGRGSYDDVIKKVPLWLKQFPQAMTKSTISHEDLPYICDSVLSLWNNGIVNVYMNVVFEDVWKDNDDVIFEQQLLKLADIIIKEHKYDKYFCSLFDKDIGKPLNKDLDNNWCGAGKMLAVGPNGQFYPCVRFADYSLSKRKGYIIGDINKGLDTDRIRPFYTLKRSNQSNRKCFSCEVASGCAWCQAGNYECADSDTIFQRSVFICKMHKARVRANNYFWSKVKDEKN